VIDEIAAGRRVVPVEFHAVIDRDVILLAFDEAAVAQPELRMKGRSELVNVLARNT
jgi:hypothetical protein